MPQMEFGDFLPQLVWLVITFAVLYILMARVALPRIAEVLEAREERIADDLERADRLKGDAAEALAAYEKTLGEAREDAHAVATEKRRVLAERAAERRRVFADKLEAQAAEADARIAATHERAMANLREVAVAVAASATARLIGVEVDDRAVGEAVDGEIGQSRDV